jgi:ABC-type multidrug transport system fused ATPase/permease subunit
VVNSINKIFSLLEDKEKSQFSKLVILMFLASILETLGIASILPLINFLTDQEKSINFLENFFIDLTFFGNNYMIFLICIIFSVYLVKNIFLSFYYWFENRFSYNTRFNLGVRLYKGYLDSPYKFHLKNNSSILVTKIVQETAIFGSAIMSLSTLITEILVVIGITLLLLIIKPYETFYVITIILSVSLIFYFLTKKITFNLGKQLVATQKSKMKILNESLRSLQEIIIFRVSKYFYKLFKSKSMEVSELGYKMSFINRMPKIWFEMVAVIIISFIIIYSTLQNESTISILGILGIFFLSALKIIPSVNKILVALQSIRYSETAVISLSDDIKVFQDQKIPSKENIKLKKLNFENNIIFKNIGFKFTSDSEEILKNINFKIKKNEFIAIVGKTGSGKTTFLNLLMGLLEPTSGQITVDDRDIYNDVEKWRSNLGFVPQNINLLDDSLKKNIAYGLVDNLISEVKIKKSIELSQLSTFLENSKEQLDRSIGESGIKISGGQKQRIAIARALYNNPEILIFDEPTSSLDPVTTSKLFDTLKKLNNEKTIILVSHDIRDFSIFDKVYEIKNQSIVKLKE